MSSNFDQTTVNLRLDTRNRGTFLSKSWRQHPNVHLTIYAIIALTGADPGFQCGTSILFVGLTNSNFVKRYKKLDEVVKSLVPGDLIPEKQVNCNASLPLNKLPIVLFQQKVFQSFSDGKHTAILKTPTAYVKNNR